jgi:predicted oxidoreductase (fatty acid repression mutant protein)
VLEVTSISTYDIQDNYMKIYMHQLCLGVCRFKTDTERAIIETLVNISPCKLNSQSKTDIVLIMDGSKCNVQRV